MTEDQRKLAEFAQRLNAEVHERVLTGNVQDQFTYAECSFAEISLEYLGEVGVGESAEACFFEGVGPRGAQMRVSGYGISEDGHRLVLLATIFDPDGTLRSIQKDEVVRAIARARHMFEAACAGFHERMERASDAYEMFARIANAAAGLSEVRIVLATNGICSTKKIESSEAQGVAVRSEIWDAERLFRALMSGLPRDDVEINFVERLGQPLRCLPLEAETGDFAVHLALLPGSLLCDLYEEYGARLLELNVRSFLSISGKVNKNIRRTIRDEPHRFVAFNNGIVITVDEIDLVGGEFGAEGIRSAKGLQIVNGGQTTASIHRARKLDKVDVSKVVVPAKIITVERTKLEELVGLVSLYANSQNVIQVADFSANDQYHVELERLANVVWCPDGRGRWFYERARGQYQVSRSREGATAASLKRFTERTPPHRKFTKTELAKFLNSWEQRPNLVSYGAQKNFEYFMQAMKGARSRDWLPDEAYFKDVVSKAILFRTVQKIIRQEKFVAFQPNILTYLVAYLSSRVGGRLSWSVVWGQQSISDELSALLRDWARPIDSALRETAGAKMVSEWAKKEACWEAIRALSLPFPTKLPPEVEGMAEIDKSGLATAANLSLTSEDLRNIQLCKQVSGEQWLRVHAWGRKTGALQRWQVGIAHTLSSYAASGWDQGPSAKQAKQGVTILQIAEEAGEIGFPSRRVDS